MKCMVKNQIITILLGIVSVVGTGSSMLTGCNEKEVGVSCVHPLCWASPQVLTAMLGSAWKDFPACHFVHPPGWFVILELHYLQFFCLACREQPAMNKRRMNLCAEPFVLKSFLSVGLWPFYKQTCCPLSLLPILSSTKPALQNAVHLVTFFWGGRWNSSYILITYITLLKKQSIITFQAEKKNGFDLRVRKNDNCSKFHSSLEHTRSVLRGKKKRLCYRMFPFFPTWCYTFYSIITRECLKSSATLCIKRK